MTSVERPQLATLEADLLLLHAPAIYDFRGRRDIYFPFLGTSGDVPVTPLYEYFPIGFKTLQRYLHERGFRVRLINLSTVMLRHPGIDTADIFSALDVGVVGIDLHWMVHVQGCLAVASQLKKLRPDIRIVLGGISSSYYAEELIRYPFVDMVMRGYDTHEPLAQLLGALRVGKTLADVPNLLWKDEDGRPRSNAFIHLPDTYGCGVDWSTVPQEASEDGMPIREFLSTQNVGCTYDCGWCGGSRRAFRRIYKRQRAMARKSREEIRYEMQRLNLVKDSNQYHFYSVGSYNETPQGMEHFLQQVAQARIGSISYEQFHLTPDRFLKMMADTDASTTITLSPQSHDINVARLAGRGVYTNEEMEEWIDKALDHGIDQIDIWYFVGMPQQDEQSVMATVDYCGRLLKRFQGKRVSPMICTMLPFLDPGSSFFEDPGAHGYNIFYKTVEEHRRGMLRASLINRINYETKWLRRDRLIHVGYQAVRRLMELKVESGFFPPAFVRDYLKRTDDAIEFIDVVHEIDCIEDAAERARELDRIGDEIRTRNEYIFSGGVNNQAVPVNRQIGGRWFDEMGWSPAEYAAHLSR